MVAQKGEAGNLEAAVALYRDDFLAGFSLRDSIPFDDWQVWQTEELRRGLEKGLEALVELAIRDQDYTAALPLAHRWLSIDPLREEVHRTLMQLYARSGQPNAALRQYRDCVQILDKELGVPPLPETTALYEAIQHERLIAHVPPQPVFRPLAHQPALASPLVGRAAELALLAEAYQHVEPGGQLLAIIGETGIGKTRLAEHFLEQARAGEATVLQARCYAGEHTLAYAPLIQLLREGLAQPGAAERLTAVPPAALAEAARLLPELAASLPQPAPIAEQNAPGAQSRFFDGVGQVLAALLTRSGAGRAVD